MWWKSHRLGGNGLKVDLFIVKDRRHHRFGWPGTRQLDQHVGPEEVHHILWGYLLTRLHQTSGLSTHLCPNSTNYWKTGINSNRFSSSQPTSRQTWLKPPASSKAWTMASKNSSMKCASNRPWKKFASWKAVRNALKNCSSSSTHARQCWLLNSTRSKRNSRASSSSQTKHSSRFYLIKQGVACANSPQGWNQRLNRRHG